MKDIISLLSKAASFIFAAVLSFMHTKGSHFMIKYTRYLY